MQRRNFSTRLQRSPLPPPSLSSTIRNQVPERATTNATTANRPLPVCVGGRACTCRGRGAFPIVGQGQVVPTQVSAEERAYHQYFATQVADALRGVLDKFPYHHTIQWSMKMGNYRQHDLNIEIEPPRSNGKN